jgi:hypothetical protein
MVKDLAESGPSMKQYIAKAGVCRFVLHPFSKLRDLPEKYSYFKCQFYVTKTAKNSKRKQTVKRHFKPYLIPKLNKNELDNLDIQTKAQYKPSQQKYVP